MGAKDAGPRSILKDAWSRRWLTQRERPQVGEGKHVVCVASVHGRENAAATSPRLANAKLCACFIYVNAVVSIAALGTAQPQRTTLRAQITFVP